MDADGKLPAFVFDRRALPCARVQEELHHRFGENFELVLHEGSGARATADAAGVEYGGYMLGGMAVLRRSMCAHGVVRDERHIRASQLDHYCLRVPLHAGPPGAAASPAHGPVFVDMARRLRFELPAGADVLVFVPREALEALLSQRLDLHGAMPEGPSGAMLAGFVRSLAERIDGLQAAEASALCHAMLQMMAAALAPLGASLPLAPLRVDDRLLVRRIGQFIDAHLGDPALCPARLGDAFGLSRSTLFRVLGPVGGPATFIRERRLARAHALLSGSRRRTYLKRAAMDCGFKDASHFSRAFRAHYGYSPSEVRERGAACASATFIDAAAHGTAANGAAFNPFAGWLHALRA